MAKPEQPNCKTCGMEKKKCKRKLYACCWNCRH